MSSSVPRDLGAAAFGLLFIVIAAALYGPTPWSAARLLRKGRQITATVVAARPGGTARGGAGVYNIDRPYPATVRLAFTLDGRRLEKILRLAEPGAETGYQAGQPVVIYVGGRLRTRIRSDAEPNAHGPFERALGLCLAIGVIGWFAVFALLNAGG